MPRSTRRSDPGGPVIYLHDHRSLSPSASVLPGSEKDKERWRLGKKHDLSELVESELRQLLSQYPLTLEEVQTVGLAIKKQQLGQKQKGDAATNASSSSYSAHELDSPRTQLALRLNSASKGLAKIRFALVPSRLKEPIFWDATIHLVKERLAQYNDQCHQKTITSSNNNGGAEVVANDDMRPTKEQVSRQLRFPDPTTTAPPPNGHGKFSQKLLEQQLAQKDAEIAKLKQRLQEVQETLLDVAKLPSAAPTSAPSKTTTTTTSTTFKKPHKGNWQMHKDSEEFLSYPPEVKEAMRTEKQKRLRQVREEMKFILDSDHPEDAHGEWDCCGGTEYHADCTSA